MSWNAFFFFTEAQRVNLFVASFIPDSCTILRDDRFAALIKWRFFSLKTFKNNTEIDVCGYFFFAQFVSLRVIHKQEHGHDTHNREKNVLHLAYTEKISNVFQMKLFWFRIFVYRVLSIFELLIIGLFLGFSCLIGKQKWKTEKMREEYEKRVYYLYDKADYYVDG